MKLKTVRVTNFRSVEDSDEFKVEQVTSLVGKNEAGKSAILLALAALNPHPNTPAVFDKERDYPRRSLTAYSQRHPMEDAVAVSTGWELRPEEVQAVNAQLGEGVLRSPMVTILRRYMANGPEWSLDLDLQKAMDVALANLAFEADVLEKLRKSVNTPGLIKNLSELPSRTPEQQKLLDRLTKIGTFTALAVSILQKSLPQFMYFSNYDRMAGAVQFEQVATLKQNNQLNGEEHSGTRLFLEFLEYAGVPLDEILNIKTFETFNAKLQAASNNITDQVLEFWVQNPDLSVTVTIDPSRPGDPAPFNAGTIGRARINNLLHRVDTAFSERSAGFVWFFSFLVKFAQVKSQGTPVILLLDEPGLTLHGKAQGDLLRYFDEKLAPYHQIIYSTHSPFMVAPDKLTSARIVEDQVEIKNQRRVPIGTKVREDVLSTDPDTLFPLQGALGYEITQSLFIGKHTLLVEGVSDILYLQALSHALKQRGRTGLDSKWTVCPTGGIGNVRAFVGLFGGNKLDLAVLADQTKQDLKKIEDLKRSEVLKTGRVFTISDFTGKAESDVEDIFEPALFVKIVNGAYKLPDDKKLTAKSLDDADKNTVRLVKKAEAAFNVLPETFPTFDHFTPAAWLTNNLSTLDGDDKAVKTTLERAEKMFASLNKALEG